MNTLYPYSLVPVLSVAILLAFTALRRGRRAFGLAMYCLSVAVWSGALVLIFVPSLDLIGERLAAVGAFISAGFLHAAYDVTNQRSYRLVWLAYAGAAVLTAIGIAQPGFLYGPRAMAAGPWFWPGMGLAVGVALIPLVRLMGAYRDARGPERGILMRLFVAGLLCYLGGMSNAVALAHGWALPFPMLLVLASLFVLAHVIREHEPAPERRLLERSLLYSALAAFLSAGFLFGVMALMSPGSEPLLSQYRVGALFLLFMAALAFEPLRQQIQETVGRKLIRDRAPAADVAHALAKQEERAEHAERLAEIGALASAVAHEIRNPLGVLSAHLKLLEKSEVEADTLTSMRDQIRRASTFVDDLLRYGRPRPLELRIVDLLPTLQLAVSTARQGFGSPTDVRIEVSAQPSDVRVEADQAQLSQVFVVIIDNALLALVDHPSPNLHIVAHAQSGRVTITFEDSGPGVPPALLPRLFAPFVTGRARDGLRPGTGLGLAIARAIVERHAGTISAGRSEGLGGARFQIVLPVAQPLLAGAAKGAKP